jgi:dihydroorotate dehydrogenase electron transfer subunit
VTACSQAKIIQNERLREGVYLMTFESPGVARDCLPGQFVMLKGDDAAWPYLKRPFSVYSSDGDSTVGIVYKVVGRATRIMAGMSQGDCLEAAGPLGRGFSVAEGRTQAVAVAGGIGIPPVGFYCQRHASYFDKITLVIGAATRDELLVPIGMAVEGVELVVYTEDGSKGAKGTACDGFLEVLERPGTDKQSIQVVACGPNAMLREVTRICSEHGLGCEVSVEEMMACGIGACMACAVPRMGGGYLHACKDGPVVEGASVDWDRWLQR